MYKQIICENGKKSSKFQIEPLITSGSLISPIKYEEIKVII